MARHDGLHIFLITFTCILLIATVYNCAMAEVANEWSGSWFYDHPGVVNDRYHTEITPVYWIYSIWALIFAWQAGWILYHMICLCRDNSHGDPLYLSPRTIPARSLASFCIGLAGVNLYFFLYDRGELIGSYVTLFVTSIILEGSILFNWMNVEKHHNVLHVEYKSHLIANRILFQNGVALFNAWIKWLSIINIAQLFVYKVGVEQSAACNIAMTVMCLYALAWFILENTVWEWCARFILTPWPTLMWFLMGSLNANWDPENSNSIISITLLGVAVLAFCIKLGLMTYRLDNHPGQQMAPAITSKTVSFEMNTSKSYDQRFEQNM